MLLTSNEAADALRDIEQTGKRSGQALGYRYAGPYFIVWGLVWIVGYAGTDLFARQAPWIWLAAIAAGATGSALVGRVGSSHSTGSTGKSIALVAIVFLFIYATYVIMWPVGPRQQSAFVPLLAGAVYSGVGVFAGARWIVAGVTVAALTLAGFFLIHQHYDLWMAAVGGGGLVLAGLWMRSA